MDGMNLQSTVISEKENRKRYDMTDRIFALLLLPVAYCAVRYFNGNSLLEALGGATTLGVGAFAATLMCIAWCAAYMSLKKVSFKVPDVIYMAFCAVLSSSFALFTNPFAKWLCARFLLISCIYMIFACVRSGARITEYLPVDLCRSILYEPIKNIASWFGAVFSDKKGLGKAVLYVICGLFITAIPTLIVGLLLASADQGFSKLLERIFSVEGFGEQVSYIVLAIIFSIYLFACVYGSLHRDESGIEDRNKNIANTVRFVPTVMGLTVLLPMAILYVMFFAVQGMELFGGFTGAIPADMTASEFAREGFFELCAVSVINILMTVAVAAFTKKSGKNLVYRIFTAVFSVMTLILIASAGSKMYLYIKLYGLTQKRIYSSWLMALLAVFFVFISVKQICPRFRLFTAVSLSICVFVAALSFANIDRLIPEYNANAYLSGKIGSISYEEFSVCGKSALPALDRLEEADTEKYPELTEKKIKAAHDAVQKAKKIINMEEK